MTLTTLPLASPPSPSPTQRWLAAARLEPLTGPQGTAERLLLLIHYGIDWQGGWVGKYRDRYWETLLPDRVWCATFQANNLRRWWRVVSQDMNSAPRTKAERDELEELLRADPLPVLEVLRQECEPLLLRVRIVAEAVRAERAERAASQAQAKQVPA